MIIAVASGKGGTGKTTIASNLAVCLPEPMRLLDCDVEEPNCHIFLKPEIDAVNRFTLPYPIVDEDRCNCCGEKVMESRTREQDGKILCIPCAGK